MLKLKNCGKEIARINSNHRMTVDEVIEAIGGIYIVPCNCTDENVKINGKMYHYEELEVE